MKIGVGILAGGKSSRMGRDKAELPYNGNSFLENLVNEFKSNEIIVSSNTNYNIDEVEYVKDKYSNIGPISGILEILKKSKNKYNFIIGVDMQNINYEFLEYITEFVSSEYKVFSAKYDNKLNPLGAIYSKEMIPIIENAIEKKDYKLINLIEKDFSKVVDLKYSKFNRSILDNINTKKDYNRFLRKNILAICGKKNSGKTTFITKVVENLRKKNYNIAVIKHDGHDFDIEENTDTGKYISAGANAVSIFSEYKYMCIENKHNDVEDLINLFREYDLIIIEGMKNSNFDKFEIVRKENSSNIISQKKLKGIITDIDSLGNRYKNRFYLNEIEKFSEFIIKNYI
ncbi:molybdopterin-guanine dinucleotide biosynthesis protein B [Miniphocaeibacter massiliensis]|uniref:molybdopterin-guanine dinucleotide biosynthesis protein B n=1 Tax=Miniphocaeibacter massiliensis TaxID=2041841 RepID=UPI000C072FDE|nr:molybdopterin-guanine dinucleotide biosynthesis protein B [Miniphocaeibacter massiliensis]